MCPRLHHSPTFRQVLSVVVGRTYAVSHSMGELPLYRVQLPPLLVQQREPHASKIMARHLLRDIPKTRSAAFTVLSLVVRLLFRTLGKRTSHRPLTA